MDFYILKPTIQAFIPKNSRKCVNYIQDSYITWYKAIWTEIIAYKKHKKTIPGFV